MTSKVDIINIGLLELGEPPIQDPDGGGVAKTVDAIYDTVRDQVLRAHPWNSAIALANLAADSAAPLFGFARKFQLPAAPYCLRALREYEADIDFKVQGRFLHSDATAPFKLIYIARITDESLFDAALADALGTRIAAAVAYQLTNSRALAKDMRDRYRDKLREARSLDGMEGTPDDIFGDSFLESRRGLLSNVPYRDP